MRDVLMLLLIATFFALCIAYVWWCDRIIGPDPAEALDDVTTAVVDVDKLPETARV
jgi:hypothetical protein